MRIYIIGNDGITLCREGPATVNEGEIAVTSKEELHAAPLNGKRLLALWNALPSADKRRKVGDREALIEQLWAAIEILPDPEPEPDAKYPSKQDEVIAMLRRPEGATVDEVANATGWQRHTVRGVFSGTLKKKLGLTIASAKEGRGRDDERYRDIRHQAVQFADRAFGFPASPLRKASVLGFITVCIGVSHHDRRQRSLALFSVCNEASRDGCGEADQQRNDHCATGRAVSHIPTGPAVQ
jgi:hypothetical protein